MAPLEVWKSLAQAAKEAAFGFARFAAESAGIVHPATWLIVIEAHVALTPRRWRAWPLSRWERGRSGEAAKG